MKKIILMLAAMMTTSANAAIEWPQGVKQVSLLNERLNVRMLNWTVVYNDEQKVTEARTSVRRRILTEEKPRDYININLRGEEKELNFGLELCARNVMFKPTQGLIVVITENKEQSIKMECVEMHDPNISNNKYELYMPKTEAGKKYLAEAINNYEVVKIQYRNETLNISSLTHDYEIVIETKDLKRVQNELLPIMKTAYNEIYNEAVSKEEQAAQADKAKQDKQQETAL